MQKKKAIIFSAILILVLAAGCTKKAAPPASAPVAEKAAESTPAPVRHDVAGNPIDTAFLEGNVTEIGDGTLSVDADGEAHSFALSERAARDVAALSVTAGTRVIVNFNAGENGADEAVSVEKIIDETE